MAKENMESQGIDDLSENRRRFIEESGLNKYWDDWMDGGEMPQLGATIRNQRAIIKRYNSAVFHLLSAMHEFWQIEDEHLRHNQRV